MRSVSLAILLGAIAWPCAAATLPARYVDLIRHDKFVEAESTAAAETAKIQADPRHKPEALCKALEFQVRVDAFDLYQPIKDRLSAVERALHCRESLPNGTDNAAHIAQLKADQAALISGSDRKRAVAWAAEAGPQLHQYRKRLDAFDYAVAANSVASAMSNGGSDFKNALAWTQESVDAMRGNGLVNRMGRARFFPMLCYRFGRLGRFDDAEAAGKSAVELAAKVYGVPSLYHAYSLRQLGQVQYFAHHVADAAVTMEQAVDDGRTFGDARRDDLAASLMIWANVLNDLGNYDRGRGVYTEAIGIMRASKSLQGASDLPAALSNLAMLEAASGNCPAALEPAREGLQIYRKRFGDDSDSLVSPLTVLGNCELETGEITQARADYTQAFEISIKTLGENNPLIAESYQQIALVDLAEHNYAGATEHLTHALSRLPDDPDTLGSQRIVIERNLARSLHAQHDDAAAFEHALAGAATRQRLLQRFAGALDENEALGVHETEHDDLDEVLALAATTRDPAWTERAWQLQAGTRAQVTRLVAARLRAARVDADPSMRALWQRWKDANASYVAALEDAEAGKAAEQLAVARDALDRAEQALAARTHARSDASPIDLAAVRAALPEAAALISFARTRADPWGNDYASAEHPERYYAFKLDGALPIALIDLGDAHQIDAAVRDWTMALRDPARSLADVDALGADLARRIWQPLGFRDDLRRVFIVPDGELHRVAWLALPVRDGVMAETGPIPQLLDSVRSLSTPAQSETSTSRALLVGAVPADPTRTMTACGNTVSDLPGAKRELDSLRALWREATGSDAVYLAGAAASKAAVRAALPQNSVVHFATHAFGEDSGCLHSLLAARGIRIDNANRLKSAPAPSGLLLAADARAQAADRDGLLTAPEVVALNLEGVNVVTLAACDTGSGPIHPGEGVFGLARAFRLAGAHNVVMSLWSVDDLATADLMQRMYRARWVEHASVADALAGAARAALADRRAEGKSVHPYYWAGFVTTGEWR